MAAEVTDHPAALGVGGGEPAERSGARAPIPAAATIRAVAGCKCRALLPPAAPYAIDEAPAAQAERRARPARGSHGTPMIKLYHCPDARSFRALWALEELGLPYELIVMPFPPRARVPGYKDLNPLGTVPVMFDGEHRMTESAAMGHYLGCRYGPTDLVVQPHEDEFAEYLNFLHMGEATLTFPQTLVLRYTRLEPPERRVPQAAEDYRAWFLARLRAAATLTGETFVCAGRFTMADISFAYALLLAENLGMAEEFPAKLVPYWQAMQARDGFRRAKAAQAAGQTAEGGGIPG
jgi:glutathione S-transferase